MTLALVAAALLSSGTSDSAGNWAAWRGPAGSGATSGSPPIEWSETKNVRWKATLPGKGLASPIFWGTHVFVATAVPTGLESASAGAAGEPFEEQEFVVLAFERASGKELWKNSVNKARREPRHRVGYASARLASARRAALPAAR